MLSSAKVLFSFDFKSWSYFSHLLLSIAQTCTKNYLFFEIFQLENEMIHKLFHTFSLKFDSVIRQDNLK